MSIQDQTGRAYLSTPVIPVGTRVKVFDPAAHKEVDVTIIETGFKVKVLGDIKDGFRAKVDGENRTVSGYTHAWRGGPNQGMSSPRVVDVELDRVA